ncbi:uncharacterized protein [Ptychodera flava]|uniref:uncharacterized protein n=1 Tax=Ptychodera flava TaxID=63121 RepID=UPI00396AA09C
MAYYAGEYNPRKEPTELEKARARQAADKYPNISDSYQYSEGLIKDACLALHGIIIQDIKLGKKELLKDNRFVQGRLYEILTYLLGRQEKDVEQILLEYEHPKLQYLKGKTIVNPKVDIMFAKMRPEKVHVTGIMLRKSGRGYEPDERYMRSDMSRLAFMILEQGCRWGFYIWTGNIDELHWMDMSKHVPVDMKNRDVVLSKEAELLPNVGKPLPASFTKTMVMNRVTGEFCLRVYRIEPEMTFWNEDVGDAERLKEFYSGYKMKAPGYGSWDVSEQIQDIRRQLIKVRDYLEADLIDHARAMLMVTKVLFIDMVTVKDLKSNEIDESDYLKEHLTFLREKIKDAIAAIREQESPSSSVVTESESEEDDDDDD